MKKCGVKLLMGALVLGCMIGSAGVNVKAEIYDEENGVTYYNSWEHDKYMEKTRKEIEAAGGVLYGSPLDAPGAVSSQNTQQTTKPSTSKTETTKKETTKPKKCEHNYESKVLEEANCAKEGTLEYTCSKCGDKYTEEIEKTTDHVYEESIVTEASCNKEGEKQFVCSVCGDSYTEVILALEHNYTTEVSIEPGCDTVGEEKSVCSICGDVITKELPALGHAEGEWAVTKEASMFKAGEQVKNCAVCNEQISVEVISSEYPISYLYIAIGVVVAIVISILVVVVIKRKRL